MNRNSWIYQVRNNTKAKIRLFCFPYSGASATIYFSWLNEFPELIEICPIQFPGRGNRVSERLKTSIHDLVEDAVESFEGFLDKPYAFFGHSLGALFSFELTRKLREAGYLLPLHLFMSGHGAPHLPDTNPRIHDLPHEEFIQKLHELNGMTKDVLENKELMEMVEPVIRADFKMCESYIYHEQEPFHLPISAYGGIEDPFVSKQELESWQKHSDQRVVLRLFPGDHFYLNSSKFLLINSLAREMSKYL